MTEYHWGHAQQDHWDVSSQYLMRNWKVEEMATPANDAWWAIYYNRFFEMGARQYPDTSMQWANAVLTNTTMFQECDRGNA